MDSNQIKKQVMIIADEEEYKSLEDVMKDLDSDISNAVSFVVEDLIQEFRERFAYDSANWDFNTQGEVIENDSFKSIVRTIIINHLNQLMK